MGAGALLAGPLPGAAGSGPTRITTVIRPDPRTGRLVRSVIVTPSPVAAQAAARPGIDDAVEQAAARHSLPPLLIHSVIQVESRYNPYAVSPKGARGLMQLMPETARRFGVSDVFNPIENIRGGSQYLKYLLDLYHDDYRLALAAYNAGEGAVARYGDVPPFPETRNYLTLVRKQLQAAPGPGRKDAAQTEMQPAETRPVGPNHIREIVEPDGSVRYVSQ